MVTVGKTETGKPITKLLKPQGYFETYNEAYIALIEYNKNPYDIAKDITLEELYDKWSEEYFKKLSSQYSAKNIRCVWAHCKPLYKMKVSEVRARHMKTMIEASDTSNGNKTRMKMVLNMMLDYALEYELVERNYARDFKIAKIDKSKETGTGAHMTFTEDEVNVMWQHAGESVWIDMMLVQCYSGWRPQELCTIRLENIDLEAGYMLGGSKTEAGKNRKVPIHSSIAGIVKKWYETSKETKSQYLFGNLSYEQYRYAFHKEIKRLSLDQNHKPHDCRVCFVTMAKKYNVNEYAIKLIVGHIISDITERIYTRRDFDWLKEEIEKLRCGVGIVYE